MNKTGVIREIWGLGCLALGFLPRMLEFFMFYADRQGLLDNG
jgi:hypothetical protein